MHLRAIKLRGFKSFPDALEVRLEPGVAVVVGPNGSGKSNVADAIVWAAGSLSPSELRAEKPDDVLFAGSTGGTPAEFCEVELLFDNQDGQGPVEWSELAIARRLHRGGEGQYLVNRTPVRRLDLVELLADLGLGPGMHSIIGQGKVELVLGSKPGERRALIEEAAGLGRFKARRHRAELKLARVGIQVDRARALEDEVRRRLRPLALQASAAERAERLAAELAGLHARLAELDLQELEEATATADSRRTAATIARRSADGRLEALLAERERAEEELADAAGTREAATAALYRLRSASDRLTLRRESGTALLEELRREAAVAEARAGDPGAELADLEHAELEAASAARAAAAARELEAERAREALARLLSAERAAAAGAGERLETVLAEREAIEEDLADAAGARERSLAVLYGFRGHATGLAARHERASELLGGLAADLAAAEADARAPGPSPEELEAAALAERAAARSAAFERDTLAERARTAAERLATLERAVAEREGLPPAARALAEGGERLALSLLEVEPGSERAVAAALGPRAAALVAPDAAAALALAQRAAAAGLGSVRVLVGRDPADLVRELPVVPQDELLGASVASVTPEGFGFDPARGELWFAGEAAEAVLLELEARRRSLATEASELARAAERAAAESEQAEERAAAAERAFAAAAPRLRIRRLDLGALQRAVAVAERLAAGVAHTLDRAAALEAVHRERQEHGSDRSGELGGRLRDLADTERELRGAVAEATEQVTVAERELARLGGFASGSPAPADADRAALRDVVRQAREGLQDATTAAAAASDRLRKAELARAGAAARAGRRRALPHLLARLASGAERLDSALVAATAACSRFEAPLRARVDAGAQRAAELGGELRRLGAAEVELRRAAAEAGERLASVEVELARLGAEAAEARRRLEAASAAPAEGEDRDELAERAARLERRREALGNVNPFAQEEYDREKARLEELSTQRADLEQSLAELEKLRDELTETVERRFAETFAAVERNFTEVAATLFPGGEGRLRLAQADEEEGAEPGIEVELRPAGKKVTRLSLLSGGEKALGAISFLFALFLARPCPFYLLDEVEAALDDTNIGRFVELLRRYADRAQFVVITHQKRTMEAADVLYGVTMGTNGISQIVSRRLPRDERAALATA
ncbi:MAG TPA: AAA family ATPase [Gaiellaceae bacterium]